MASDGARKHQNKSARRVRWRTNTRARGRTESTATAIFAGSAPLQWRIFLRSSRSHECHWSGALPASRLLPGEQPVDRALGVGKRRLGVLAAQGRVLDLGPERILQLGLVGQRPVAGEPVGV